MFCWGKGIMIFDLFISVFLSLVVFRFPLFLFSIFHHFFITLTSTYCPFCSYHPIHSSVAGSSLLLSFSTLMIVSRQFCFVLIDLWLPILFLMLTYDFSVFVYCIKICRLSAHKLVENTKYSVYGFSLSNILPVSCFRHSFPSLFPFSTYVSVSLSFNDSFTFLVKMSAKLFSDFTNFTSNCPLSTSSFTYE